MKSIAALLLVLFLSFSTNVPAAIVSIPLDCAGDYIDGSGWSTELTLGQQFSTINSLSIQWSGLVTSELYAELGYSYPEFSLPGAFIANISVTNPHSSVAQAVSDTSQWELPFLVLCPWNNSG
jgi:hypothetical protein